MAVSLTLPPPARIISTPPEVVRLGVGEEERVNTDMQKILLQAYGQVAEKASRAKTREAACTITVDRVVRVERLRGT